MMKIQVKNQLNNKKASLASEKLIKGALVAFVIAIVIFGLVALRSSGILKNILPSFGPGDNSGVDTDISDGSTPGSDTPPSATVNRYIISLSVKHWINKDYYYFKYDSSTKNNLRLGIRFPGYDLAGWYINPNENPIFKRGKIDFLTGSIPAFEKNIITNIMSQDSMDKSIEGISTALKNPAIVATWGTVQNGAYQKIDVVPPDSSIASIKLRLTGEQPKNA